MSVTQTHLHGGGLTSLCPKEKSQKQQNKTKQEVTLSALPWNDSDVWIAWCTGSLTTHRPHQPGLPTFLKGAPRVSMNFMTKQQTVF